MQQYIANVQGLEHVGAALASRVTTYVPHTQTQLSTRHQLAYLGCRVGQPTTHGNQTTVPLTCNVRRPSKVRCHSLVTSPSASPSPGTFCAQACGMPRTHARATVTSARTRVSCRRTAWTTHGSALGVVRGACGPGSKEGAARGASLLENDRTRGSRRAVLSLPRTGQCGSAPACQRVPGGAARRRRGRAGRRHCDADGDGRSVGSALQRTAVLSVADASGRRA